MKEVKVSEAFAGYGSQMMALRRLEREFPDAVRFVPVGISEIDRYAIAAYNAVHEETVNYGDISKIDRDDVPDFNLFTYSFPCTDISNAGKQMGLAEGSGTRSSLLWECRRAIEAKMPEWLLMENVKALTSEKFLPYLHRWMSYLDGLGYTSFTQVLNAKDYGVPQNRERVFMVSIRGGGCGYEFPEGFKLERRLRDILEKDVDERYYLSDKTVARLMRNRKSDDISADVDGIARTVCASNFKMTTFDNHIKEPACVRVGNVNPSGKGMNGEVWGDNGISPTVMVGKGEGLKIAEMADRTICLNPKVDGRQPSLQDCIYDVEGVSTAITTSFLPSIAEPQVLTPRRTDYGKAVRKEYEKGNVRESRHNMTELVMREDGVSNTLTSVQKDNLVVEPKVVQVGNLVESKGFDNPQRGRVYSPEGISPTLDTCGGGNLEPKIVVVGERKDPFIKQYPRGFNPGFEFRDYAPTVTTSAWESNNFLVEPVAVIGSTQKNAYKGSVDGVLPCVTSACGTGGGQTPMIVEISPDKKAFGDITGHLSESEAVARVAEELAYMASESRGERIEVTVDDEGNMRPHRLDKRKSGVSEYQTEKDTSVSSTLISARPNLVYGETTFFRIRKLTPRECFRLMGVSEEDIDRIQDAGISNSQQYKLAGNSIVVDCLYYIFKNLFIGYEKTTLF